MISKFSGITLTNNQKSRIGKSEKVISESLKKWSKWCEMLVSNQLKTDDETRNKCNFQSSKLSFNNFDKLFAKVVFPDDSGPIIDIFFIKFI